MRDLKNVLDRQDISDSMSPAKTKTHTEPSSSSEQRDGAAACRQMSDYFMAGLSCHFEVPSEASFGRTCAITPVKVLCSSGNLLCRYVITVILNLHALVSASPPVRVTLNGKGRATTVRTQLWTPHIESPCCRCTNFRPYRSKGRQ